MTGQYAVQPLVLLVDDDGLRAGSLASTLASRGIRTLRTSSRADALSRAMVHHPDLVLLDFGPFRVEASLLTSRLRDCTSAPILAILEEPRESHKAAILDAGASECIVRPFGLNDLLSRLRVWLRNRPRLQLRRTGSADAWPEPLRIDSDRRTLHIEGREVHITPLECKLLVALARNAGRSMTEEQLLRVVWGSSSPAHVKPLRTHVRRLRIKLERDAARPRYLVTDASGGYALRFG